MNQKSNLYFIACLFFLFSYLLAAPGFSQTAALEDINQRLEEYTKQVMPEKVFVHTDRSFYMAGETLWFKGYVVEGVTHKPLNMSKVAYIELLDHEQKPLLQSKISLENGNGDGSFYLPLSLPSGQYKFRAYTNWMKNSSPDYFFEKEIKIVNPFTKPDLNDAKNRSAYEVRFFPEGGNLVEGIKSKVAFKVVDEDGKGASFRGAVLNERNDTLLFFQPYKFGMGHFYMTPSADTRYRAVLKMENEVAGTYELPEILDQGYVMEVANDAIDQLSIVVKTNSSRDGYVYLLAHTRQEGKVAKAEKLENGEVRFIVDKSKLGDGISHLTVFDRNQVPVCERLYFKQPKSILQLKALPNKESFASREQVGIEITAGNLSGVPAEATLSVAVFRTDSLDSYVNSGSILDYLWLSSDLQGKVESPDYYFQNSGVETALAVDNLMLTQGWRRFKWNELLAGQPPSLAYLPEYEGHLIEAEVLNKKNGLPVGGVGSFLSIIGKPNRLYYSKSNTQGKLLFIDKDLYGKKEIVLQVATNQDSLIHLRLNNSFSEKYSNRSVSAFDLDARLGGQLQQRSIDMQVQNTFWEGRAENLLAPKIDSMSFYGRPANKYLLDNYVRFPTMEEVMREYITEVAVRKRDGKFILKVYNRPLDNFFQTNPLVLLDGIPVWNIDKLMATHPLKIKEIEVVTDGYFLGEDMLLKGIVSYTTYKNDLGGFQLDPHQQKLVYDGMDVSREFYSPIYGSDVEPDPRKPDFRSLLFWSPDVVTDKKGIGHIQFYTSDLEGDYIAVIQGITKEGFAGVNSLLISVEKQVK